LNPVRPAFPFLPAHSFLALIFFSAFPSTTPLVSCYLTLVILFSFRADTSPQI
jgi:hypothetical protein